MVPRARSTGSSSTGSRSHAAGMIDRLRRIYPSDEWGLFTEVRSTTGMAAEVLSYADALAVRLSGESWRIHGF
jgi:hypothetical protein